MPSNPPTAVAKGPARRGLAALLVLSGALAFGAIVLGGAPDTAPPSTKRERASESGGAPEAHRTPSRPVQQRPPGDVTAARAPLPDDPGRQPVAVADGAAGPTLAVTAAPEFASPAEEREFIAARLPGERLTLGNQERALERMERALEHGNLLEAGALRQIEERKAILTAKRQDQARRVANLERRMAEFTN